MPCHAAHLEWPPEALRVRFSIGQWTVSKTRVHQFVSIDGNPDALTTVISAQALQLQATGGEFPYEV